MAELGPLEQIKGENVPVGSMASAAKGSFGEP
jgi:hypothetical protein